jgi:3-dehydroquinate dehydratase
MKLKAKDISDEVRQNGGSHEHIDWKELSSDGYDAVIINQEAYSFSRFGLENAVDFERVIL